MNTFEELQRPLTEVEKGELQATVRKGALSEAGLMLLRRALFEIHKLKSAITKHHAQKADDRCWLDDDDLYLAAGLPIVDRRVGDKAAMLENCKRFVNGRCDGGGWKSYAELERENKELKEAVELLVPLAKGTFVCHHVKERHEVSVVGDELEHGTVRDGCQSDCPGCATEARLNKVLKDVLDLVQELK